MGDGGVGKTSLLEKFLSPENCQFYESVYGNYHYFLVIFKVRENQLVNPKRGNLEYTWDVF